jgi:NADH dehydrogenase
LHFWYLPNFLGARSRIFNIDKLLDRRSARVCPNEDLGLAEQRYQGQPRVVIVGGGFGGLEAARRLRALKISVALVDRHNYHLFQPLLYQVATGALSPANIAAPLRAIFRRQANCQVILAEVVGFDIARRAVLLADGELPFDYLILAAGSATSYFGRDDWRKVAPGLKTIENATDIRRRIYLAFEAAERETDTALRKELLTFVVVGAGPTGVELAGALSEIARHTLKNDFRHIDPRETRILLVEAAGDLLAHFPAKLREKADRDIRSLGIEIHLHTRVTAVDSRTVQLTAEGIDTTIATRTVLWAAGVAANPLGRKLAEACGVAVDRAGRVPVNSQMNVGGETTVFAIGDIAAYMDEQGRALPGVAPVAIQQGRYVAARVESSVRGGPPPKVFRYRDPGTMATIGRSAAVAEIKGWKFYGFLAWVLWLVVHLMQIVQFQNRLLVFFQWGWSYITFGRSARLITGEELESQPLILIESKPEGDSQALNAGLTPQAATGPTK